jgi:hypothetical protein
MFYYGKVTTRHMSIVKQQGEYDTIMGNGEGIGEYTRHMKKVQEKNA